MPGAAVCFDAAVAAILVEGGFSVLLCGTDGEALGRTARALGDAGRVAVLTADPGAEGDLAVALTMAGELFGTEPVVVRSVDQARARCKPRPMG